MKSLVSVLTTLLGTRTTRTNLAALAKMLLVLAAMITVYSLTFHWLMLLEGREHSWITGFYWTLTVMTTLGFGDITFASDIGRAFSILVMVSGVLYLLVLLPFSFIEFFYAPWMKARENAKTPKEVPDKVSGHVILAHFGPVEQHLVRLLAENRYPYFVLVPSAEQALALQAQEIPVIVADPSLPQAFEKLRVPEAAMVVTTLDDITNTNVTFTVRELSETVPVVASAIREELVDALELAGATRILRLEEMLGRALARRVLGNDTAAHVIGDLDGLLIAEVSPGRTTLVGKTLEESALRELTGATVVGLWQKGECVAARPDESISAHSLMVLAGTREQIDAYDERFAGEPESQPLVVIVGGGRVGRVIARQLTEAGIDWKMIEQHAERVREFPIENLVIGDAADFDTLVRSGLHDATTAIITTHDDKINVFLTIFIRRLRHDMQLIARCTDSRNAPRMHRAGADLVLSYASMGSNVIFNELSPRDTILLAEGVNIFSAPVPGPLEGRTLAESNLRARTGCSVIAVEPAGAERLNAGGDQGKGRSQRVLNPGPDFVLPAKGRLILNGSLEAERRFFEVFQPGAVPPKLISNPNHV